MESGSELHETGEERASVGTLIRRRRRAAGLTQAELAERARVSLHAVSNLERGAARLPHQTTLDLIAQALDLAPADHDLLRETLRAERGARFADDPFAPGRPATLTLTAPPLPLTPLFGRDDLMHEVARTLRERETRLLTLVGSPGVGKTRLALAVAGELLDAFAQRVAYVPLAALDDITLVLPTIAQRLGVAERNEPVIDALVVALGDDPLLLVLDNFEQTVEAAPQIVELLARVPGLTVTATSRVPLGLRGERQIVVPPLLLPTIAEDGAPLEALLASPAVAVFLASAQRAVPSYHPTAADAPAIAAICRRLDGLPLALELAAPRLRLLSPAALLERLEHRLPIAETGPRDLPRHQRTLRDTIAWSYDRLSAEEQRIFRVCGVFAGGATLPAVEYVAEALAPTPRDVHGLIEALLEKNLVVREPDGASGEPRIRMLETLRDFALEALRAAGEIDAAQRAHASYHAARIEEDEAHSASKRSWWVARCDEDLPNLRAALQWAMSGGEIETGLRISGALGTYWYLSGRLNEGMRWLRDLLALAGGDQSSVGVAVRAKALYMAGWIACDQGRSRDAVALLGQCVSMRRRHGSRAELVEALQRLAGAAQQAGELARAERILRACLAHHRHQADTAAILATLNTLGNIAYERGADLASEEFFCEALPRARAHGEAAWTVLFLVKLSRCAYWRGDCSGARALFAEGARLAEVAPPSEFATSTLFNLAYVARDLNTLDEARDRCTESVARFRADRHDDGAAYASLILGVIALELGDLHAAASSYADALAFYERLSSQHALAECLDFIAALALARGAEPEVAAMIGGAATALRERIGSPRGRREREAHERTLATLRGCLGPDALVAASRTGAALSLPGALALTRSVLAVGHLAVAAVH